MDNVIKGFNLKAIEILHTELSKMIEQNQLLMGNSQEIFRLSLWGKNYLRDMDKFLGLGIAQEFATEKTKPEWDDLLNPLFQMFQTKVRVYFEQELPYSGKELPLLSM